LLTLSWFFFFILFGGTGVWTEGFTLAKQALYCLSHTFFLFCFFRDLRASTLVTLEMGVPTQLFAQVVSNHNLLDSSLQVVRIVGVNHQHKAPWFIFWFTKYCFSPKKLAFY
jgi:hypothetical protein